MLNAYAPTVGGLLVVGGRAGELGGRKGMFRARLVVFTVVSLLGGLATSEAMLIAARARHGSGASDRPDSQDGVPCRVCVPTGNG